MRAVVALPLLLGPGLLACFDGGYFDGPRLWAAIGAWALLAIVAITLPRPLPATGPGRLALAGLAALTAWTALSLTWAPDGGPATDDLQRLLLYLPYLAAAIAVLRPRETEPLLLLAIAGACAYGLSERFGFVDLEAVTTAGDRLAYPLSYWNATGAFAALGLILSAALAGDSDRPACAARRRGRRRAAARADAAAHLLARGVRRARGRRPRAARPLPYARPPGRRARRGRARRRRGRACWRPRSATCARSRERAPPRCRS